MTTLYCPKCGYNLSNLPENRCPECGEAFDPKALAAMQARGISTRNVLLQLILIPIVFAVALPICLVTTLSGGSEVFGAVMSVVLVLGMIVLHASLVAPAYSRSRKIRDGELNVPWVFRHAWACAILFAAAEAALTFMYFAGGCAVIIMNLNFH